MWTLVEMGGPIKWVILGLGFVAFIAFVERAWHLHRARIKTEDFLRGILNVLKRGNYDEALSICEETPGPVAYIVKTAVLHRGDDRYAIRAAIDDIGLSEISRLERRLVVVATVAQISPVLGLLGTVLAMIKAVIAMEGSMGLVQQNDVLHLIKDALVSTGAGLIVAICAHASYNLLVYKIEGIVLDMERTASEIVAFLSENAEAIAKEKGEGDEPTD